MTLPSNNSQKNKYIPYGGKRLEALHTNTRSTLSTKRLNSNPKAQDVERHSMEFEEKFRVTDSDHALRIRSKTIGDLNEVSADDLESEAFIAASDPHISRSEDNSETSSCSNLSVSSQSGSSAKLTFASANPLKYSSAQVVKPQIGSPVWKPRNEANVARQQQFRSAKAGAKVESHGPGVGLKPQTWVLHDTEC